VAKISSRNHVVLKEGDFFGEMALLERRRHQHDVVAKTRCRVYVLDVQSLARLADRHPEILRRIREVAVARAVAAKAAGGARRKTPKKPAASQPV
jgi:voltage-gated potassium channel